MSQKQTDVKGNLPTRALLAAGFDLTTKHIWLLIVPILVDCFYWLGPRLSFSNLFESLVQLLLAEAGQQQALAGFGFDFLTELPATNLFASMSLPFIGVPALMVVTPTAVPLTPDVIEIPSLSSWFLLLAGLWLLGLLLSTLFFALLGRVFAARVAAGFLTRGGVTAVLPSDSVDDGALSVNDLLGRVVYAWPRLLALLLALFVFLLILYIPAVFVGTILALLLGPLGFATILLVPFVAMWLVVYLSFVPHGLLVNGRSLRRAVVESGMIVHRHFASALSLLLTIWLINLLVDSLLLWADAGTWFTLIPIVGHAFISTSLLMATFVFYQDRYAVLYRESY